MSWVFVPEYSSEPYDAFRIYFEGQDQGLERFRQIVIRIRGLPNSQPERDRHSTQEAQRRRVVLQEGLWGSFTTCSLHMIPLLMTQPMSEKHTLWWTTHTLIQWRNRRLKNKFKFFKLKKTDYARYIPSVIFKRDCGAGFPYYYLLLLCVCLMPKANTT